MTRVIVAIDADPVRAVVVPVAARLVPLLGDRLDVVTAGSQSIELDASLPYEVRGLEGPPAEALLRESAAADVTAVAIGVRAMVGGPRPAGHVTELLLRGCDIPVLAVPPGVDPRLDPSEQVLVPLEGAGTLAPATVTLLRELERTGSTIDEIHVFDRSTVPMFWNGWDERARFTEQFIEQYSPLADPQDLDLRVGDAADQILMAARERRSTLIVIEWKRELASPHAPIVRHLLSEAAIPLLLIPRSDEGLRRSRAGADAG
jgi:hypothetical protein